MKKGLKSLLSFRSEQVAFPDRLGRLSVGPTAFGEVKPANAGQVFPFVVLAHSTRFFCWGRSCCSEFAPGVF